MAATAAIAVVWLSVVLAARALRVVRDELHVEREAGTLYSSLIGYIGMFGNFAVVGVAYLIKDDHEPLKRGFDHIPFFWVPIALLLISFPLARVEKAITERRRKSQQVCPPNGPAKSKPKSSVTPDVLGRRRKSD